MPLAGYSCPPGSVTYGERHDIDWCLSPHGCQSKCVSPPLLRAIYNAEHANHHVGNYISVSMLQDGNCARKTVLERSVDFYEYPVNRYWAFRGTIGHGLIERAGGDLRQYGWLQEIRMLVPLTYPDLPQPIFDDNGVWTGDFADTPLVIWLGGTTDAYNILSLELDDYKSMADRKVEMMVTGEKGYFDTPGKWSKNLEDKWVYQTNTYRWMLANTKVPDDIREQFDIQTEYFPAPTKLRIQGFSMMSVPLTGQTVEQKVFEGKWPKKKLFKIDDIPVLPMEEIEAYIRPRALQWYKYLVMGQYPPVVPESAKWLCSVCPFNGEKIKGERCLPTKERAEWTGDPDGVA